VGATFLGEKEVRGDDVKSPLLLTPTILKKENRNAWGEDEINFLLWATIIMLPCLKGTVGVNFAYFLVYS
jgi:hypothetical protein